MKFGWIIYSYASPGYLVRNGKNVFTVAERDRAEVHFTYPDWAKTNTRRIIPVAIETTVELFEMSGHIVKEGECLSVICKNAGVEVSDVIHMNSIRDANLIFPGNHLILPPKGFRLCLR